MTGSQIRTALTRIIDSLVDDENEFIKNRDDAIDDLLKIIENYRETL